jgi:hypothetical protein
MPDLSRAVALTPEVEDEVDRLFLHIPWDVDQQAAGARIRIALAEAFKSIIKDVPPCPTRTVALRKIVEARMDCNSAITHKGQY